MKKRRKYITVSPNIEVVEKMPPKVKIIEPSYWKRVVALAEKLSRGQVLKIDMTGVQSAASGYGTILDRAQEKGVILCVRMEVPFLYIGRL